MSGLSQEIDLFVSGIGLKNYDHGSLSDTFAVVKVNGVEVGRTETIRDSLNPRFAPIRISYHFESVQQLRVEIYDRDTPSERLQDHDLMGHIQTSIGRVMGSVGQHLTLAVTKDGRPSSKRGSIALQCEAVSGCNDILYVRFAASGLDRKDWFGGADPYLEILRTQESGPPTSVWRSETLYKTLNPTWAEAAVPVQQLCNADTHRPLILRVWDWDKRSEDDYIGECTVSVFEMLSGRRELPLINAERQKKKGRKYKNSGMLRIPKVEVEQVPSFVQFLRGGLEMSLVVAVDYTASNGAPSLASSLHHRHPMQDNAYQQAMRSVGTVLLEYDHDKEVPIFGFGGQVNGSVSHCFPLTFDPSHPEVSGVEGLMSAYESSFASVSLSGPTLFAPIINAALRHAAAARVSQANQQYFTLLILTDGVICDMSATIDAIVEASEYPMSIVIVGVGNADFSAMEQLDGDDRKLRNSRGREAKRDIVQFVPFNSRFQSSPAALASETLAELPSQVLDFMKLSTIRPNAAVTASAPGAGAGAAGPGHV